MRFESGCQSCDLLTTLLISIAVAFSEDILGSGITILQGAGFTIWREVRTTTSRQNKRREDECRQNG